MPETVAIEQAAHECGMTVEEFLTEMVLDGLLVPAGETGYATTASPFLKIKGV